MDNKDNFEYSYSAGQQKEIKSIRDKYIAREEDKLEQLRRLDAQVTRKGSVLSLVLGIISALILGFGMSLAMTEIGGALGVYAMPIGIAVGVLGLVGIALAYPLYVSVTKKEREKIAPVIIRLSEELLK